MKKIVQSSFALSLLLVALPLAHAGFKASGPVFVSTTSRFAQGGMGDSRSSAGTTSYIGCKTLTYGATDYLACFAATTSGTYASCYTYDARIIAAARSITTASYIYFYWDASGVCGELDVTNMSQYAPMVP